MFSTFNVCSLDRSVGFLSGKGQTGISYDEILKIYITLITFRMLLMCTKQFKAYMCF